MSEAFDRLAKRLAEGSRRDILKALGGFLTGSLLLGLTGRAGGWGDDPDDDVCYRYCRTCRQARCGAYEKCLRACSCTLRKNPSATPCGSCTASVPFTACTGGATCCSGACINLHSKTTCGTSCSNYADCTETLGSGAVCCSGVCTNFTAATTCGSACGNTVNCTTTVGAGATCCPTSSSNACCASGQCCDSDGDDCTSAKPAGGIFACCSGCCLDITGPTTCGTDCSHTTDCTLGGTNPHATCCLVLDTATDTRTPTCCNAETAVLPAGVTATEGDTFTCCPNTTSNGTVCADLSRDPNHCGSCTTACTGDSVCCPATTTGTATCCASGHCCTTNANCPSGMWCSNGCCMART